MRLSIVIDLLEGLLVQTALPCSYNLLDVREPGYQGLQPAESKQLDSQKWKTTPADDRRLFCVPLLLGSWN